MGGSVIRRLVILLGIKADTGDAPKVGGALDGIVSKAMAARKRLLGVTAAISTVFGAAVIGTSRHVQEVSRWSDALGVPAEDMQALGIAFQGVGLEMEDAADLMFTAAERLVDAGVDGAASDAAQMAKRLGISLKEANGDIRSHESILFDVADAMQRVATDTERTAIANTFFGDVGVRSLGLLKEGGEALRLEVERIKDTGAVMTQEEIDNVKEANKQFHQLATSVKGFIARALGPLFRVLGKEVLPTFRKTVDSITSWLKVGERLERINKAIATGFRLLGIALASFGIFKAVTGFIALGKGIKTAALAMRALGTQALFAHAKLFLIPAAIAGVLILLEDISVWLRGGDSLIGRFIDKWKEAPGVIGGVARALDAAKPALQGFFTTAADGFAEFFGEIRAELSAFSDDGGQAFMDVLEVAKLVFKAIATVVFTVVGTILKVIIALNKVTFKIIRPLLPAIIRIMAKVGGVIARLVSVVGRIFGKLLGVVTSVLDRFGGKASSILAIVLFAIEAVLPVVIRVIEGIIVWIERIVRFGEALSTFILGKLPALWEKVKTGAIAAMSAVGSWFVGKWDALTEKIKDGVNAVASLFGAEGDKATAWWTTLSDAAVAAFSTILEWIEKVVGPLDDIVTGVGDAVSFVTGSVDDAGSAIDSVSDFLSGGSSAPTGPSSGRGGFLDRQAQAIAMRGAGGAAGAGRGGGGDRNTSITQSITIQGNADPATVQAAARRGATGGVDEAERRAATRDLASGG